MVGPFQISSSEVNVQCLRPNFLALVLNATVLAAGWFNIVYWSCITCSSDKISPATNYDCILWHINTLAAKNVVPW